MKMHDPSFRDPIIAQPEPITLILPLMMEILRWAGIKTSRDEVVKRLMAGRPRIAVVHGGEDHPAQVVDQAFVKKAVRSLWLRDALPFPTANPGICDGITEGHIGMSYTLLSRNLASLNMIAQSEAHGYQGALVLTSCDKRPAGEVTGFIQVDLARRRKGMKPFYTVFLPNHVMPEMFYPSEYLNRDLILRYITILFTDGRYSGATRGPCIGHVCPEAARGGPIALFENGDLIRIDIPLRSLEVIGVQGKPMDPERIEQIFNERKKRWEMPKFPPRSGVLKRYLQSAAPANKGAYTEY